MVFGVSEPAGSTVFEVPLTAEDYSISWGELQHDMGVDADVRLYMAMLARRDPDILMPNNLGDVLYTTNFGMSYSNPADITISLLTVPEMAITTETESNGRVRTTTEVVPATQKAGVPFEICFVAENQWRRRPRDRGGHGWRPGHRGEVRGGGRRPVPRHDRRADP